MAKRAGRCMAASLGGDAPVYPPTRSCGGTPDIAVAGGVTAGVALAARVALDASVSDTFWGDFAVIAVAGSAGIVAYGAAVWVLRVHEARTVWGLVQGQVARLRGALARPRRDRTHDGRPLPSRRAP